MPGPFISLTDVHKTYPLGLSVVRALRGVSLTLDRGDFIALVGASGSGKSTLLNMVGCLDTPDQGSVVLYGQDVNRLSDDERSALRNRKIGFVFQSFNLIPVLNVAENVELPLLINPDVSPAERRDRVRQAIEDVQLTPQLEHVPDQLSGGQRQRVAIARAMVTHPLLIIADEPTANLDSETTHRIIDLMIALNQKRQVTFLFSTHDEKLMDRVHRTVRIHDGMIVA